MMDEDEDEDEDADADEDADESPKEKRYVSSLLDKVTCSHMVCSARELADKKELFYQYNTLLKTMPDLKTDVHLLTDAELETLADFVSVALACVPYTDARTDSERSQQGPWHGHEPSRQ